MSTNFNMATASVGAKRRAASQPPRESSRRRTAMADEVDDEVDDEVEEVGVAVRFAESFNFGLVTALAVTPDQQHLLVTDAFANSVYSVCIATEQVTTLVDGGPVFINPTHVTMDRLGKIYYSTVRNVARINPDGTTVFMTQPYAIKSISSFPTRTGGLATGALVMLNGNSVSCLKPGVPATVSAITTLSEPGKRDGPLGRATFDSPAALTCASDGNIYVADTDNHAIRVVSVSDKRVTTLTTDLQLPVAVAAGFRPANDLVAIDNCLLGMPDSHISHGVVRVSTRATPEVGAVTHVALDCTRDRIARKKFSAAIACTQSAIFALRTEDNLECGILKIVPPLTAADKADARQRRHAAARLWVLRRQDMFAGTDVWPARACGGVPGRSDMTT